MSATVVRGCYGCVARLRLHVDVERAVIRAINAAAPGPAQALLNAGRETRLPEEVVLARASTAFLNFAVFNLSDDLSDGDCIYLPPDEAAAVVLILGNVFFSAMRTLGLPDEVEDEILADLLAAEEAQALEITTTAWGAERVTAVTDGIAGRQWSAYLKLLWAGTPLASRADSIARWLGRVGLLAGDIRSGDARYTGLSISDRQVVVEQALAGVSALEAEQLSFLEPTLAASAPVLLEESKNLPHHRQHAGIRRSGEFASRPKMRGEPVSQNKKTVETYLDGFRKNDHGQILSCLTDDIEWTVFGAFHLTGKQAYDDAIEAPGFDGPPRLEVVRMVEEGDVVMAELTGAATRDNGEVIRMSMAEVFVMRDAKIAERRAWVIELKENDYR